MPVRAAREGIWGSLWPHGSGREVGGCWKAVSWQRSLIQAVNNWTDLWGAPWGRQREQEPLKAGVIDFIPAPHTVSYTHTHRDTYGWFLIDFLELRWAKQIWGRNKRDLMTFNNLNGLFPFLLSSIKSYIDYIKCVLTYTCLLQHLGYFINVQNGTELDTYICVFSLQSKSLQDIYNKSNSLFLMPACYSLVQPYHNLFS